MTEYKVGDRVRLLSCPRDGVFFGFDNDGGVYTISDIDVRGTWTFLRLLGVGGGWSARRFEPANTVGTFPFLNPGAGRV